MTDITIEHKVGQQKYARVGETAEDYLVIGAPRVNGTRWLTLASRFGGPIASYPEESLGDHFWVPNPVD